MKILKVRFKNLNSLEGEWEIDFTHPAYSANPIFAITGPTGSGKTTLLDAVCLALYGRTPRLKIISKSINEIMTRQTGECFAEVTFETLKGRYRCHWSQHRARKKPAGDLQQPRHEIVDHGEKRVLENMIKKVAIKVEEVTGMTFDQFTRSILLAQGSFAAFLQASPDERAPLLEQLTGTEIYSRISQKVHELTAQQEKVFTRLNDELTGLAVLSVEEHEALNTAIAEKHSVAKAHRQELDALTQKISWLEKLDTLQQEIQTLAEKHHTAQELKREQATLRTSLQRAKIASLYRSQHEYLCKMKNQQEEDVSTINRLVEEEQSLQKNINIHKEQVNNAAQARQKAEERLEKEREVIAVVRTLDVQILDGEKQQEQEENKFRQIMKDFETTQQMLDDLAAKKKEKERQLQKCCDYLEKQKTDASLPENLPVLREKIDQLQVMIDRQQKLARQLAETQKQGKNDVVAVKKALEQAEKTNKVLLETEQRYTTVYEAGTAIRHEYPQLMQQLEKKNQQLVQLEKQLELRNDSKQTATELDAAHQQHQNFLDNLKEAQYREDEIQKKQQTQNQLIRQQEEIVMLAQRVKNYEEERAALQPGSPCPLCGATNHPYQEDVPPLQIDETAEDLAKAKTQLTVLQEDLVGAQTDIKFYRKQLEETRKSKQRLQEKLEKQQKSLHELEDLFKTISSQNSDKELLDDIEKLNRQKKELRHQYEELEKLDRQVAELRAQVDGAKEEKITHDRALETAKNRRQQTSQKEMDLREALQALAEDIQQQLETLSDRLSQYGCSSVKSDELRLILEKLQIRHDRWQQHIKNENNLKEELRILERDQHGHQVGLDSLEKERQAQKAVIAAVIEKLANLTQKRKELYGKKSPDTEEQQCKIQLTEASRQLEKLKEECNQYENRIINLQAQLDNLKASTAKRAEQLRIDEQSFTRTLRDQGFHDVEEFTEAILPEKRISELESEFSHTDESIVELATLLKEKQKDHRQELARQLTSAPREQLQQNHRDCTETLQQILQEIGRIQGRLEENEKYLDQQKQKREALQSQKQELERWQKLDWLIGSASGKKFRNFAQGITFDIMVDHANKNLKKMTDRYILVRDQLQPLELNIIDNYRGGDIRSTQNLSGGESFLVSLALALGLSSMAGDSVRVDSFFLDEGFGTLDEETLDTALQTLAGLQQEGKMIGIISHVSLLKERLDTQIQLIPKTGGHSALKGPGIRSLQ